MESDTYRTGRAGKFFALAVLALAGQAGFAEGTRGQAVFYFDEHSRPVVRLDRIPLSDPVKAILALYALQNGAGCGGKNEQDLVTCALTSELGLGANCSEEHLRTVRRWFSKVPSLSSRWNPNLDGDARKAGALEALCYRQPDTASWQNIWAVIRMDVKADVVTVDAIFFGGSQHGRTRARYQASYRIGQQEISVLRSKRTVLESSARSIFE